MEKEFHDKFLAVKTRMQLAEMLNVSDARMRYYVFNKKQSKNYITFYIRKRNGSKREINAPDKNLKRLQEKYWSC